VDPFTGNTNTISSVAFSPDGQRIASASHDGTISLWNSATGEVIAGPSTGHSDHVISVAFSPDGKRLTSASDDQTIRMWDVTTWECVLEAGSPTGPTESGLSVPSSSSSDRQPITSVSQALTIRVKGRTDSIEKVYFMDRVFVYRDGWMCGEEGELFLWVPQIHRAYIQRSNTVWIAGRHYTQLDFSNFVHGSNWTTVYVHSPSK
jgi:WD40 repeat protein